jgi:hypothetical protein
MGQEATTRKNSERQGPAPRTLPESLAETLATCLDRLSERTRGSVLFSLPFRRGALGLRQRLLEMSERTGLRSPQAIPREPTGVDEAGPPFEATTAVNLERRVHGGIRRTATPLEIDGQAVNASYLRVIRSSSDGSIAEIRVRAGSKQRADLLKLYGAVWITVSLGGVEDTASFRLTSCGLGPNGGSFTFARVV